MTAAARKVERQVFWRVSDRESASGCAMQQVGWPLRRRVAGVLCPPYFLLLRTAGLSYIPITAACRREAP